MSVNKVLFGFVLGMVFACCLFSFFALAWGL